MQLTYTYWEAKEGGYIGFLNQYPDYWTQGDNIKELEDMLSQLIAISRNLMIFTLN